MNVKISFRFLTRILSIVSVVLCVVSLLVSGWENVLRCVSCSFSVGTLSLLAAAEYGENVKLHFVSSIVCGVIPIATGLLDANQGSGNVLCVSVVVLTFARTLERTCSRYYRIKALFRQKAVWTSVEDYYGLTLRLFLVRKRYGRRLRIITV